MIYPNAIGGTPIIGGHALNSALVMGTSGAYAGVAFVSPVSQTAQTLSMWVYNHAAVTGAPTNINWNIYPQGTTDPDRPQNTAIGTQSADLDMTGMTEGWVKLPDLTVSLTVGERYFALVENKTATPASNYPQIRVTGGAYFVPYQSQSQLAFLDGVYATNGFSVDGVYSTALPFCMKFADGDIIGMPFAVSSGGVAGTDWRGIRFRPFVPVRVSGVYMLLGGGMAAGDFVILKDGVSVYTGSVTYASMNRSKPIRFPQILVEDGVWDFVFKPGSFSGVAQFAKAGISPPAEVLTCFPDGISFVSGASNTSLTEQTDTVWKGGLMIDEIVIPSGGGGSGYSRSRVVNQ